MDKVIRSNRAHYNLRRKYNNDASIMGATKWHYHSAVVDAQLKNGKIISRKHRRSIFNRVYAAAKRGDIK